MSAQSSTLILGGVGGIGEALARRLVAKGERVVVTSRSLDRATALANSIGAAPAFVDIADEASLAAAVQVAADGGKLSGLVYAIGTIGLKPLARTSAADMLDAYRVNVVGAMLAVRAATAALQVAEGSVVLFSSIAARQGFANHTAIGAAKAGVEGLTLTLAAELAPKVRVNAIAPSLTDTPLASSMVSNPRMAEAIAALHPLPRLGNADEVAAAAQFLLSRDAGWITGQILGIDGGRASLRTGRS